MGTDKREDEVRGFCLLVFRIREIRVIRGRFSIRARLSYVELPFSLRWIAVFPYVES